MHAEDNIDNVVLRSNPYAKTLLLMLGGIVALTGLVFIARLVEILQFPTLIAIPLALAYGINIGMKLMRLGPEAAPKSLLVGGIIFMAGGSAFDMIATVSVSPQLDQEGNPIARSLLDSGAPPELVIAYGFASQLLVIILSAIAWAGFLKHWRVVIASAWASNPKTYLQFVKAATGGENLSWRQFLLPLRLSDFANSYHLVWLLAALWFGQSIYRWYLGFAWLIPSIRFINHTILIIGFVLAACVGYLIWLWYHYEKSRQMKTSQSL